MTAPVVLRAGDLAPLVELVRARAQARTAPPAFVVAIDGRSGSGKSTLAAQLAAELDAVVVDGDAFFAGGVHVRDDAPQDRADACIHWRRQREVIAALREGRRARYLAFDWEAFDGRLEVAPTELEPRPVIIVEGVYSARPELRDVVDLRVLMRVPEATRVQRLVAREGAIGPWDEQWHEAEAWYFAERAPAATFDVVVDG